LIDVGSADHQEDTHLQPDLLCIGGEDHSLRIPFLLALRDKGLRISSAGSGDPAPFARAGLDYHPIQFARFVDPLSDWSAFNSIAGLIADLGPKLVQCFDTKLNVLVPLATRSLRDVAVISTINGLGWLYSSRSLKALTLRPVYRGLQRLADRSTAVTVFQNSDDQTFFMRHRMVGKGPHVVIPGSGIDIIGFDEAAAAGPPPEALRDEFGLGTSEVVLTVTRMTREKGVPTLLEAAAIIHGVRPDVRFLLVGPRESEGRMAVDQAEIERHAPYVMAVGSRRDVPALLRLADVFACPTELREGIPRVLLEAAAAGRPIVATRMPGCTDVIRDGWSGFLVAPHSPRHLAERILDLLRDRDMATEMGAKAATFVRQELNLDVTVERYAAVYQQLLDNLIQCQQQASKDGIAGDLSDREPHKLFGRVQ
jgi:glycosyltransferase involved in cell wall biosynthesis